MHQILLTVLQPRSGLFMNAANEPCRGFVEAAHIPNSKRHRLVRLAKEKAHFEQKSRKEAKWK